ncbi:ferredoxin [Microbacterium sp. X-17]|uniref:ferredoxin n=1 Tax=Microbacterium sp. X-17 TaxID=3144404 RepID=UPI0031F4FF71
MINVSIDLSRCQGYGNCLTPGDGILDINDEGQAFLLVDEIPEDRLADMRAAAAVCPVAAIAVVEA